MTPNGALVGPMFGLCWTDVWPIFGYVEPLEPSLDLWQTYVRYFERSHRTNPDLGPRIRTQRNDFWRRVLCVFHVLSTTTPRSSRPWTPKWPTRRQTLPNTAWNWPNIVPTYAYKGPKRPKHKGLRSNSKCQLGPFNTATNLTRIWPMLEPCWAGIRLMLGLDGSFWAYVRHLETMLEVYVAKRLQSRAFISNMLQFSTQAV